MGPQPVTGVSCIPKREDIWGGRQQFKCKRTSPSDIADTDLLGSLSHHPVSGQLRSGHLAADSPDLWYDRQKRSPSMVRHTDFLRVLEDRRRTRKPQGFLVSVRNFSNVSDGGHLCLHLTFSEEVRHRTEIQKGMLPVLGVLSLHPHACPNHGEGYAERMDLSALCCLLSGIHHEIR